MKTSKPWAGEICQDCGCNNIVGFTVASEVWAAVMGSRGASGIFCIWCFDKRATERGVDWTAEPVNFWPVSTIAMQTWATVEEVPR